MTIETVMVKVQVAMLRWRKKELQEVEDIVAIIREQQEYEKPESMWLTYMELKLEMVQMMLWLMRHADRACKAVLTGPPSRRSQSIVAPSGRTDLGAEFASAPEL